MKILHVNTADFTGASSRNVLSLHRELRASGQDSHFLAGLQVTDEPGVELLGGEQAGNHHILRTIQGNGFDENFADPLASFFTLGYPARAMSHPLFQTADIIHLHDVKGLLSPEAIGDLGRSGKKIIWSLVDPWPFTGGCHTPVTCRKFTESCSDCPQLTDPSMALTEEILFDKKTCYGYGAMTLLASGEWLAESSRASEILQGFPVEVIPPLLDTRLQSVEKILARMQLGLPEEGFVLLIPAELDGAQTRGQRSIRSFLDATLHYNSFKRLARSGKLTVIVLGHGLEISHPDISVQCFPAASPERLSLILSAVDLAAFPRIEENTPAALQELGYFGVPVVAFDAMGLAHLIQNEKTGMVIANWDLNRMAEAVSLLAIQSDTLQKWSDACRHAASNCLEPSNLAQRYLEIYQKEMSRSTRESIDLAQVRPRFQQYCLKIFDSTHTTLPSRLTELVSEAEATILSLQKSLHKAVRKLELMERRFTAFQSAPDEAASSENFTKALESLKKLQDSLIKELRVQETTNRHSLLRPALSTSPLPQHILPGFLEKWLVQSIVPRISKNAGKGFGKLYFHPPKILRMENFPAPSSNKKNLPSIAMVIPSFMQGHFIERTLASITEQNYPKLFLAVQDAGSTDKTLEVLQKYAGKITTWSSTPDTGQARAIREGFSKIKGDIMAWLNSDDLLLPGTLRFVGEYFRKHPEVDAIYGHRVIIDENDDEVGRWILPPHDPDLLHTLDYVPQETLFWRSQLWEKVGGIDPKFRFAMDWDLLLRFSECGAKMVRVPYFMGCFRVHPEQKTSAVMNTVGAEEITHLRFRTLGRVPTSHELGDMHKNARRRSALYEMLLKFGIRL